MSPYWLEVSYFINGNGKRGRQGEGWRPLGKKSITSNSEPIKYLHCSLKGIAELNNFVKGES